MLETTIIVSPSAIAASSDQTSYCETAAIAATLARRISDLAINKSDPERRRLRVLRDAATKIHVCLTHVGVR